MNESPYLYSVFTKAEPDTVKESLPKVAEILASEGVKIFSVAGPTNEDTIVTCGQLHIPFIRVMVGVPPEENYWEVIDRTRKEYDALIPLLEEYDVAIGVQNHCDYWLGNAAELMHLLKEYDPKHVAAIWDAAHEALNGSPFEMALDMVVSHLRMVNLKNAFPVRRTGPEAEDVSWKTYWTNGRQGLASWPKLAGLLRDRNWQGILCLTAEYSDHDSADRLIAEDMAYAKSLFG